MWPVWFRTNLNFQTAIVISTQCDHQRDADVDSENNMEANEEEEGENEAREVGEDGDVWFQFRLSKFWSRLR